MGLVLFELKVLSCHRGLFFPAVLLPSVPKVWVNLLDIFDVYIKFEIHGVVLEDNEEFTVAALYQISQIL